MGQQYAVICKNCSTKLIVCDGGGFFFHLLHCDTCGVEKSISFDELGDIHNAYLKGSGGAWCVASREHDKYVREHYKGEPINEKEYFKQVEEFANQCECGGRFTFNAKPRCPRCRSRHYKGDDSEIIDILMYD